MSRDPFSGLSACTHTVGVVVQSSPIARVVVGLASAAALGAVAIASWRRFRARLTANSLVLNETLPVHSKWWRDHAKEKGDLLYVAIGDSAAQGIGASSPSRSYVGVLADEIRVVTGRTLRVVNLSVSGATVELAVRDQLPRFVKLRPDIVTVAIGANDIALWDPAAFERGIREIFAALPVTRARRRPAVLLLPAERAQGRGGQRIVRRVAAEHGLTVVPLHAEHEAPGHRRHHRPSSRSTCSTPTTAATGCGPMRSPRRSPPSSSNGSRPLRSRDRRRGHRFGTAGIGCRRRSLGSGHGPAHLHVPLHRVRLDHRQMGRALRRMPAVGHRRRRRRGHGHRARRAGRRSSAQRAPHGRSSRSRPPTPRTGPSGIGEFDRVLGGGIVAGRGHPALRRARSRQVDPAARGRSEGRRRPGGACSTSAPRSRRAPGAPARRAHRRAAFRALPRRRDRPRHHPRPDRCGQARPAHRRLGADRRVLAHATDWPASRARCARSRRRSSASRRSANLRCCSSATSPKTARSPGRACSNTSSTSCASSRATGRPPCASFARTEEPFRPDRRSRLLRDDR